MTTYQNAVSLAALIGRHGMVRTGAFNVAVRVLDVKMVYGETRYYVTPVAGNGEAWVTGATFKLGEQVNG